MTNNSAGQLPNSPVTADDAAGKDSAKGTTALFPVVGIGASAGGLEAFTELLKHLPLDTGMGFVLVQHLDPQHESALTQLLARATSMPVRKVTNNLRVEPDHVYIIPPDTNLVIAGGVLNLKPRSQTRGANRSIDFFFEALAQDKRERAIGVILSGTATDGTLGLEAIKAEGGITLAQDDSAKYDSMPRSAVAAGCVDFVLKPEDIAKELARIAKHPYVAGQPPDFGFPEKDRAFATAREDESPVPSGGRGSPNTGAKQARAEAEAAHGKAGNGFFKILLLLRSHSGVDFSLYKSTTIQRRVTRRMVLNKQDTLSDYERFLRGNAKELDALYSDVLISVTSFFRNSEAFEIFKRRVFPKLLQQRSDDPLRVWVLGCSTGQEAYSIAMAFVETAEKSSRTRKLQVFATDLNDALLDKARHGFYAKRLAQDVSPERLRRFFVEEEGGYRIIKPLREMVVFARQNLIADPPFSRMDLISCRNLLIYLEPSLQQKALPTFHYALKPEGFLFLGASESIGNFTELFEPIDKKHKIYSRKAAPTPAFHLPEKVRAVSDPSVDQPNRVRTPLAVEKGHGGASGGFQTELNAQREADRVTVNQFAPPGVLVNAALQILQFRGPTSAYLEPPTGKASFDVLKMAREGLMLPLRAAINKAKKENKITRKEHVRIIQDGTTRTVNLKVIPLKNLRERCFLILFEDAEGSRRAAASPAHQTSTAPHGESRRAGTKKHAESRQVAELEVELSETRDYLQSIQEQYEAANEELQASNEEVQSSNEELQSVNEELETSKEELESANEELTTVNEEMDNRNIEVNGLNSDLTNLQNSTHLAIVLLGRDLTVRRFSAQAEKQFNLLASDVGRPIGNVRHKFVFPDEAGSRGDRAVSSLAAIADWNRVAPVASSSSEAADLESLAREVIETVRERDREIRDKHGHWYSLRVRPYMTLDKKVDGAVLVLVDIDDLKRNERIQAALDFAQGTVDTVREPLLVLDGEMRVRSAGRAFYRHFRVSSEETIGRFIYDLGNHQWNIPRLRTLLEDVLPQNSTFNDFEVDHEFEHLGRRIMLLNGRRLEDPASRSQWILLAIEDITDRVQHERELQRARLAEAIIATARDPLVILEADLRFRMANEAFYRTFKVSPAESEGRLIFDLGNGQWKIPRLGQLLKDIVPRNTFFDDFEITHDFEHIGHRTMLLNARKLAGDGVPERILLGIQDITEVLHFQTAARESEARKDAILKSALDAIITMDHEGKCLEFNPAAEKLFGYSRAEALRKPLVELIIPARLRERHNRGMKRYLATGEGPVLNRQIEMPAVRADGTEFPAELAIIVISGAQPPMFTCFLRDISERKRAEAARAEQARLLNLSNDALIVRDIQDCVIYWNRGAEALYGWSREEALGKVVHSLLQNEFPKPLEQIQEELHRNNHWTGEIVQTKRNGQCITVLSRWTLDRDEDGNPAGVLAVNTDITERKRVEQALRDAGERKNEFLAMLAHELRNPIAPIRYMLEIMRSAGNNAELMEQARSTMERQLFQMTRLVDDLLDVSRISRGKLNLRLEQVELVSVLRHVVEACRPVMGSANHELTVALPPDALYLNADPVRLTQVFGNLLSNAVKFTQPGGRIALTAEQQGREAVVSVKDSGVGIPPNMLPKVFEMFTQANQELERTQGGLGIGLTLVERLVEMHGGSVKAFSEGPGQGSEFVVRLPGLIEKPKPQLPEPTGNQPTGAAARRILVVDDNRDAAESLALLLQLSGHETHMAHDGLEAVEAAATFKPDVVLLDIGLPKLNGYDVCRRIRQQAGGNGIVLIALTGWGQDEDRRKSQEAGFNGHLVKPVDHSSLTNLLAESAR